MLKFYPEEKYKNLICICCNDKFTLQIFIKILMKHPSSNLTDRVFLMQPLFLNIISSISCKIEFNILYKYRTLLLISKFYLLSILCFYCLMYGRLILLNKFYYCISCILKYYISVLNLLCNFNSKF